MGVGRLGTAAMFWPVHLVIGGGHRPGACVLLPGPCCAEGPACSQHLQCVQWLAIPCCMQCVRCMQHMHFCMLTYAVACALVHAVGSRASSQPAPSSIARRTCTLRTKCRKQLETQGRIDLACTPAPPAGVILGLLQRMGVDKHWPSALAQTVQLPAGRPARRTSVRLDRICEAWVTSVRLGQSGALGRMEA
jgi:hypothetical protein